jgi:hypothetical protein
MSSELQHAWKMVRVYGPRVCRLDRLSRINWVKGQISALEAKDGEADTSHIAACENCRSGRFCLYKFACKTSYAEINYLRGLIKQEQADEEYSCKARVQLVDYKRHTDGFCRYWQNLRMRLFEAIGWACEKCGGKTAELECHHLHYGTLGFEDLSDVRALCRQCHSARHAACC